MPLKKTLDYVCDQAEPVICRPVRTAFVVGDSEAHQIRLTLTRDGAIEPAERMAVTASMIRADNTTVVISGDVEDGMLCVTLPPACYSVPGRFQLLLRGHMGGIVSTLLWLEGTVINSITDTVISPDKPIPSLFELLNQLDALAAAAEDARAAAEEARAAAALPTHCYVQPYAPENPVRGDLWVTSPDMYSWGSLADSTWTQAQSDTWQDMLTAENPILHVYDGFAWRTFGLA